MQKALPENSELKFTRWNKDLKSREKVKSGEQKSYLELVVRIYSTG